MKYVGEFNLDLLHEELEGFVTTTANGRSAEYRILVHSDGVTVELDDPSRFPEVDKIIEKHDPKGKSAAELAKEQKEITKVSLKTKLESLGLTSDELAILGITEE